VRGSADDDVIDTLVDGLVFPEGPRWRGDTLWCSDIFGHRVLRVDADGAVHTVAEIPTQPSGLGFLPDGSLLVVSMLDRRLLRVDVDADRVIEVADLSALAPHECNDMVVDATGRAYVGSIGVPIVQSATAVETGSLILVEPGREPRIVADRLSFPNGCVVTPDGRTLIVAETIALRLTAFDVEPDGSLTGRRVFADIGHRTDGLCLDAEGAVWVASPNSGAVFRARADGEVVQRIDTDRRVLACALGGPDGRTLHLCTVDFMPVEEMAAARSGRIETLRVDVPGVELP
jgi:sugar lactone lactonase YvrE